ncbi:MAG: amidohydrolase family protein [Planctomycetes bacterium]|nr:amidohydrolase family protein [Planctomycetota bacterium]
MLLRRRAAVTVALARWCLGIYRSRVIASEWIVDRLVLPHVLQHGARLAASDGRLVAVDQAAPTPQAVRLRGTLLPGFVDLQVNGAGGAAVDTATPAALDTVARAVERGGAVAFLPTLITAPWPRLLQQVDAVASWIERWSGGGAEPLGLHVEGPFLVTPGAHDSTCFVDPTPARVQQLLQAARGRLRLVTLGHARPGAAAATAMLTAAGVTVSLGHCDRSEGFTACVDAGASTVTHLFNVMGTMHHREVSVPGLALDDARVSAGLVVDGVHVHPAMVRTAFRVLGPDRLVLVSDAVGAAGMPDGDYTLSGARVVAKAGVVRDDNGNLAGSALTMATAARNFLHFVPDAGDWTLARIASGNPARLARADHLGSIAVGKRAAFTLRADDGTFTCVRG